MRSEDRSEVGYRKPPRSTRFKKGTSGNPKGRPRGRIKQPPYETVLGQMVTIREGGVEQRVTAAEAFVLQMTKRGLEGDSGAAEVAMKAIEDARAARRDVDEMRDVKISLVIVSPGSVTSALEPLRMGRKLDRRRASARVMLEPWVVQAALDRLGDTRLSEEEQHVVLQATRTSRKVNWPNWWTARP